MNFAYISYQIIISKLKCDKQLQLDIFLVKKFPNLMKVIWSINFLVYLA